jgi:hypothetical protein
VFDPLDCLPTWRPIASIPKGAGKALALSQYGAEVVLVEDGRVIYEPKLSGQVFTHWCPLPVMP